MLACKFVCQSILQGDTAVRTVKGKIMALWQKMRRSDTTRGVLSRWANPTDTNSCDEAKQITQASFSFSVLK